MPPGGIVQTCTSPPVSEECPLSLKPLPLLHRSLAPTHRFVGAVVDAHVLEARRECADAFGKVGG